MAGAALIASLAGILASTGPFIELRWQTPVTTAPIHEAPEVLGVANDRAVVQHDDDCLLLDATGSVLAKRRFGDAPLALASRQLVALEGAAVVGYATDAGFEARWRLPAVQRTLLPYGTRLSAVEAEHVLLLTGRGCGARCPNESNLDHPSELLAVDAATGAVRWRRSSGREVDEAAAEGDRFLVASRCEAIAYQADSGRLLWRTGRCRRDSDDQSRIALADDAVYFTPAGQKLVKLDPKGGRERWKIPLGGMAATELVAGDGAVYVALEEGTRVAHPRPRALLAVDAATGRRLWERRFEIDRLLILDRQTLVVEELAQSRRAKLLLVDRKTGEVRDAFRIGGGGGVQIEPTSAGGPRLVVGSAVGVLGLGLGDRPPPRAPQRMVGRLTASGPLAGFPIMYEAPAPGWPIQTAQTDDKGGFEILVDARDVVPIWLDPQAVERRRQETSRGNPRWTCIAEPDVHYVLGSRAPPPRLDTGLFCFDPYE